MKLTNSKWTCRSLYGPSKSQGCGSTPELSICLCFHAHFVDGRCLSRGCRSSTKAVDLSWCGADLFTCCHALLVHGHAQISSSSTIPSVSGVCLHQCRLVQDKRREGGGAGTEQRGRTWNNLSGVHGLGSASCRQTHGSVCCSQY